MTLELTSSSLAWAALTNPETGQLPSLTPSDWLGVPGRVEIDGDVLCFYWMSGTKGGYVEFVSERSGVQGTAVLRFFRPPQTLLERFVRLRSDEDIFKFARRFGPLAPRGMEDVETASGLSEHRES